MEQTGEAQALTNCNCECESWACLFHVIYENHGLIAIGFLFLAYVFYRLVWRVWNKAMNDKEKEIQRIAGERDFYAKKVVPDLISSDPNAYTDNGEGQ